MNKLFDVYVLRAYGNGGILRSYISPDEAVCDAIALIKKENGSVYRVARHDENRNEWLCRLTGYADGRPRGRLHDAVVTQHYIQVVPVYGHPLTALAAVGETEDSPRSDCT